MKLSEIFCFDSMIPKLGSDDRNEVIGELVSALGKAKHLGKAPKGEVTKAIIQREDDASTGIGKGVAVPHVKHESIKKAVAAIGISEAGIDFSSLDKQPVYTVILLISPAKDPDKHLQAMEQIFKLLQDDKCRKFLKQAQSETQIKDILIDFEEGNI